MNPRVAAIALSLLFLVSSSSTQEIPIDYQQISENSRQIRGLQS